MGVGEILLRREVMGSFGGIGAGQEVSLSMTRRVTSKGFIEFSKI